MAEQEFHETSEPTYQCAVCFSEGKTVTFTTKQKATAHQKKEHADEGK